MDRLSKKSLQSRLNNLLESLEYNFSWFTLEDFIRWVEKYRNRELILIPFNFSSPHKNGAWVSDDEDQIDFVFYQPGPPEFHAVQNILHELSHILCNHIPKEIDKETVLYLRSELTRLRNDDEPTDGVSTPSIEKAAVGLFRSLAYTDEQEAEAETLASIIQARVLKESGLPALMTMASYNQKLADLMRNMGFEQ
jgi:hypothetical protein